MGKSSSNDSDGYSVGNTDDSKRGRGLDRVDRDDYGHDDGKPTDTSGAEGWGTGGRN